MANPSNSVRSVAINFSAETSKGLLGPSGKYSIYNERHTLSEVHSKAGYSFEGIRLTSTISKIIAYIASFFGMGKMLTIQIAKDVIATKSSHTPETQEHTFWVDRNIDAYVEEFGSFKKMISTPDGESFTLHKSQAAMDLTIEKTSTLWFDTMIAIRANCSKEESIAGRKFADLPLLVDKIIQTKARLMNTKLQPNTSLNDAVLSVILPLFAKLYSEDELRSVIASPSVFEKRSIPESTQPAAKQWGSLLMTAKMRPLALEALDSLKARGVDQLLEVDEDLLKTSYVYYRLSDELIATMDFNNTTAAEFYQNLPPIKHSELGQMSAEDFVVPQGFLFDLWRIEKLSATFTTLDSEKKTVVKTLTDKKEILLELTNHPISVRNAIAKCLYQDIAIKFAEKMNLVLVPVADSYIGDISHHYSLFIKEDNIRVATTITATVQDFPSPNKPQSAFATLDDLKKGAFKALYALNLEKEGKDFAITSTPLEAFRITVD